MCKMRKSRKQYCRVQKFASYSDEMDLLRHDGMVWGSAVLVSFGGSITTNQYRVLQTDPLYVFWYGSISILMGVVSSRKMPLQCTRARGLDESSEWR